MRISIAAMTDVGKVRSHNEDAFVAVDLGDPQWRVPSDSDAELELSEHGALLAVSDGMGGAKAGELASSLTIAALVREMRELPVAEAPHLLQEAVEQVNEQVAAAAQSRDREGMGATLTAAWVRGAEAFIAHVGDSRAYLVRAGLMHQITKDQSYLQMLLDSGAVSAAETAAFPYRSVILQAIGTSATVRAALYRVALCKHDRLLLCSDGLSSYVDARDILAAARGSAGLSSLCAQLVALANGKGGEDNVTVVLAEFDGQELHEPEDGLELSNSIETLDAEKHG